MAQHSTKHGTINGIVLDRATQAPLRGIHVRLLNTNRGAAIGAEGRFIIMKVPAELGNKLSGVFPPAKLPPPASQQPGFRYCR